VSTDGEKKKKKRKGGCEPTDRKVEELHREENEENQSCRHHRANPEREKKFPKGNNVHWPSLPIRKLKVDPMFIRSWGLNCVGVGEGGVR